LSVHGLVGEQPGHEEAGTGRQADGEQDAGDFQFGRYHTLEHSFQEKGGLGGEKVCRGRLAGREGERSLDGSVHQRGRDRRGRRPA
jgi:hypothetical protein